MEEEVGRCMHRAAFMDDLDSFLDYYYHPRANPNLPDDAGRSVLQNAQRSPCGLRVFEFLLGVVDAALLNRVGPHYTNVLRYACFLGRLEQVRLLLVRKDIDVNARGPRGFRGEILFEAIAVDASAVLGLLLADPRMDLMGRDLNQNTPLLYATRLGSMGCLELLLRDKRFDPNEASREGIHAISLVTKPESFSLFFADPRVEVMRLFTDGGPHSNFWLRGQVGPFSIREMVAHPRFNPNVVDRHGRSPLWVAFQHGYVEGVREILASSPSVDLGGKPDDLAHCHFCWELGKLRSDFTVPFLQCARLIMEYHGDPKGMYHRLRVELGYAKDAELLSLVVFTCDDLLAVPEGEGDVERFFRMARPLCFELQMLLCSRVVGKTQTVIGHMQRNAAFAQLAKKLN